MKNLLRIFGLILLLSLPAYAYASPVYLTLEGTVGSIWDNAGLASSAGIKVGDIAKYVMVVDTDLRGTETHTNGNTYYEGKKSFYSYSYQGLLSGGEATQYNFGDPKKNSVWIASANGKSTLELNYWDGSFDDIKVGTQINSLQEYASGSNEWVKTTLNLSNVSVTRMSNVAPTPLPGALLLMGGGLGLVGFIRRKFGKNS